MKIQKNVLYITTRYLTTQLEIFQKLKLITRFRGKLIIKTVLSFILNTKSITIYERTI